MAMKVMLIDLEDFANCIKSNIFVLFKNLMISSHVGIVFDLIVRKSHELFSPKLELRIDQRVEDIGLPIKTLLWITVFLTAETKSEAERYKMKYTKFVSLLILNDENILIVLFCISDSFDWTYIRYRCSKN